MKTLQKIKLAVAIGYVLLILAGIVLFSCGKLSVWWLLAPVWAPILSAIVLFVYILIFSYIGDLIKKYQERSNPPCCENCLWAKAHRLTGHCIGESEGHTFGTICDKHLKI